MANKAEEVISKINSLWVEKYRPTNVGDLACDAKIINFLTKCINQNDVPNLLFYGKPGVGKNSIVNVLLKNMNVISLTINASEERGIDTIRDKVMVFAQSSAWGNKLKIIILNEADGLNYIAQDSLRELMETSSKYCRFILTCNYIGRISDALKSRCIDFELNPKPTIIANRLITILTNEQIDFDDDFIIALIKKYGVDIRKMINELQKLSIMYTKFTIKCIDDGLTDKYYEYFEKVFATDDIKKIAEYTKKIVFDDDIYTSLKNYVIDKNMGFEPIMIIGDCAYKTKIVTDKDLVLLCCIFTIKDIIKEKK